MSFTTNMTGTTQLDDSLVLAFAQQFLIAAAEQGVGDQFVSIKEDIGAKSIQFTKYAQVALATTPLTEDADVVSTAMSDTQILLTPAEYGMAITKTELASLQTGGKIDAAAAKLVGINMGRTQDALCIAAGEASSNVLDLGETSKGAITASNIMTVAQLNIMYNKLSRENIMPLADGQYIALMHDDVIHDLRNASGAGSWQDLTKYQDHVTVLRNEVGSLGGFRVVRDNHCKLEADAGAGSTVDVYSSQFLGFNALGKAISRAPQLVISGPFDKLARFVNVGWKGVFKYGIIDQDAHWLCLSASSVGVNA